MLNHGERLRLQNEQLANATGVMYSTEKTSFEIMDNMEYQNKVAAGSRNKVIDR